MRTTMTLLPLAALLASTALAQGPRSNPPANGDGIVTRAEESAGADRRFAAMDADHDGIVTPQERRAARERMRVERRSRVVTAAQFRDRAEKRFHRLDTNDDGRLTGDERRAGRRGTGVDRGAGRPGRDRPVPAPETAAAFRARAPERFDRIDTNRDGRIDQAERTAARDRMGRRPGGLTPSAPVAN